MTYLAARLLGLDADATARAAGISGSFASGILGGMIAADGFSCGPGPIRYAAGAITACTLLGAWSWGGATVPAWQRTVINFIDELSRVGDRALRMAA